MMKGLAEGLAMGRAGVRTGGRQTGGRQGKTEKADRIERRIRHEEGQCEAGIRVRLITEQRSIGHGTSGGGGGGLWECRTQDRAGMSTKARIVSRVAPESPK